MSETRLSLDVAKSNDLKVMRLFDTSYINPNFPLENYLVEIMPVNKKSWVTHFVKPGFSLILNSSNLRYNTVNSELDLIDLPDGIYEIKQSYKPNINTVQIYYYLRTSFLRYRYLEALCGHLADECKQDKRIYAMEAEKLSVIAQYIDAAEYVVEKGDKKTGIKYYNYTIDLIKKFEHECGCR